MTKPGRGVLLGVNNVLAMAVVLPALALAAVWAVAQPFSDQTPPAPREPSGRKLPSQNPFLIVSEDMYGTLQSRAQVSPWSRMVQDAIWTFNTTERIDILSQEVHECSYAMRDLTDAAALLYIVDPANRAAYLEKLTTFLVDWQELVSHADYGNGWHACVPLGTALFTSVLALDVVHDDLDAEVRDGIEQVFGEVAGDFYNQHQHMGYWPLNTWAAAGIWYLYTGDTRLETCVENYRNHLFELINKDGVFQNSITYAGDRLSTRRRIAKTHFMDVLEFTGVDPSYYSERRLQRFYHWVYALALTPNGKTPAFGDTTAHDAFSSGPAPGIFRAHRFSKEAGEAAAWRIQQHGYRPIGSLINYVLHDEQLPDPVPPRSRIYYDGGAFFIERSADNDSLYGALWNPKAAVSHAHKDINAIHLYAYGEHIMRNSGYNYWGEGVGEFTWEDIQDRAWTNNVVLINDEDHSEKYGGGIQEGFTTASLDYAAAVAGPAISSGEHTRSLIMVSAKDGAPGYFILVDEATATPGDQVSVLFHPNGDVGQEQSWGEEYEWLISPWAFTQNETRVTLFAAREPEHASVLAGPIGDVWQSFVSEYLRLDYEAGASGAANILTAVVPHDRNHPKAVMQRIEVPRGSGIEISLGNDVIDVILETDGSDETQVAGCSFLGTALVYRASLDEAGFIFVRRGTKFDDGTTPPRGFTSAEPVSVFLKNRAGRIVSSGTEITFYWPAITGVHLTGTPAEVIASGDGWITAEVPPGTFVLEIEASVD